MLSNNTIDPSKYISTFDAAALALRSYIDEGAQGERVSVKTYYRELDDFLAPLMGGELGVICARPGRLKTTLLLNLARLHCERAGGVAVIVTSELPRNALEIQTLSMLAGVDVSSIRRGGYDDGVLQSLIVGCGKRETMGLVPVGHATGTEKRQERLNPHQVAACLDYLRKELHINPTWLGQDYIQKMPADRPGESMVQDVGNVLGEMRMIAVWLGVPLWACVQAGRGVDDAPPYIPGMVSAQWSSAIEQDADAFLGLMYPCKHWGIGKPFQLKDGGKLFVCRQNMLLVCCAKQRYGEWPRMAWLKLAAPNRIEDFGLEDYPNG